MFRRSAQCVGGLLQPACLEDGSQQYGLDVTKPYMRYAHEVCLLGVLSTTAPAVFIAWLLSEQACALHWEQLVIT